MKVTKSYLKQIIKEMLESEMQPDNSSAEKPQFVSYAFKAGENARGVVKYRGVDYSVAVSPDEHSVAYYEYNRNNKEIPIETQNLIAKFFREEVAKMPDKLSDTKRLTTKVR